MAIKEISEVMIYKDHFREPLLSPRREREIKREREREIERERERERENIHLHAQKCPHSPFQVSRVQKM